MRLPALVAHADWSSSDSGRAIVTARREADGRYAARLQLEPVVAGLLDEWLAAANGETAFIGFDFPIGLPRAFAARRAIGSFPDFLRGINADDPIFSPAVTRDEISLERPFYPARPGERRFADLTSALGLDRVELLRLCDRPTNAACMFWTIGPQQCGKAALAGWRDLIIPGLQRTDDVALWPYDGSLAALLDRPGVLLSETYPAHAHRALQLLPVVKSTLAGRERIARQLTDWASRLDLDLGDELMAAVRAGFPKQAGGDHAFDALIGLLLMLALCRGEMAQQEPDDPISRTVEGWMLGLSPSAVART